jgi:hypothetical protein
MKKYFPARLMMNFGTPITNATRRINSAWAPLEVEFL